MARRVAVLVEQQYQEMEVWYPYYRLSEAGATVVMVGPEAGKNYPSKLGYPAKSEKAAKDVSAGDFDGVVIPGGFAPDYFRRDPATVQLVKDVFAQGKVVAAICHGPWLLCSTPAPEGQAGDVLLLDQGRRDERRRQVRGRGDRRGRQRDHGPQAGRPAGVPDGGDSGPARMSIGERRRVRDPIKTTSGRGRDAVANGYNVHGFTGRSLTVDLTDISLAADGGER